MPPKVRFLTPSHLLFIRTVFYWPTGCKLVVHSHGWGVRSGLAGLQPSCAQLICLSQQRIRISWGRLLGKRKPQLQSKAGEQKVTELANKEHDRKWCWWYRAWALIQASQANLLNNHLVKGPNNSNQIVFLLDFPMTDQLIWNYWCSALHPRNLRWNLQKLVGISFGVASWVQPSWGDVSPVVPGRRTPAKVWPPWRLVV